MLGALLVKELKNLVRNKMLLGMVIMYPIVVLLALPWATNMDVNSLRAVVVDPDGSSTSQMLRETFFQSNYFIEVYPTNETFVSPNKALTLLESGEADIIITLPDRFEAQLVNTGQTEIEVKTNAINATKGVLGVAYAQRIVQEFVDKQASKQGKQFTGTPVVVHEQILFSPTKSYRSFILPALITILITLLSFVTPSLNMVQEKEFGTIEQMNVTPVKGYLFMLSKTLPYNVISIFMVLLSIPLSGWVYNIWFQGNIGTLVLATFLYATSLSSLGMVISNKSSTQQQAMFVNLFAVMFLLLMSGVFTPISGMPIWAKSIAYAEPLTYYVRLVRALFLKGGSFYIVRWDLIVIALFSVGFSCLALLTYKKRV